MIKNSDKNKVVEKIKRYDIGYSGYEAFDYMPLFHFKKFSQKKFNEMVYDAYYEVLTIDFLENSRPIYDFSYLYIEVAKKLVEKYGFFMIDNPLATFFGKDMIQDEDDKLVEILKLQLDSYDLHLRKKNKHPINKLIMFLKENVNSNKDIIPTIEKYLWEEEVDHYFVFPQNFRAASKKNKNQIKKYKRILNKSIKDVCQTKRKVLDIEIEIKNKEFMLGFDYEYGWMY